MDLEIVRETKSMTSVRNQNCKRKHKKSVPLHASPSETELVSPVERCKKYQSKFKGNRNREYNALIRSRSTQINGNVTENDVSTVRTDLETEKKQCSNCQGSTVTCKRCPEMTFTVPFDILEDSARKLNKRVNDNGDLGPQSYDGCVKRKLKKDKMKRLSAVLTCSSQTIPDRPNLTEDRELNFHCLMSNSLEDLQEWRISGSPPYSRKMFRSSMPICHRKPETPSSSFNKPYCILEDRRRCSSACKRTPKTYVLSASSSWTDNGKQTRHLYQPKVILTRGRDESLCSNENRSPETIEPQDYFGKGANDKYDLRIKLPPRSKSNRRGHKSHVHDGFRVRNQIPDQQTKGNNKKTKSHDIVCFKSFSLFSGKSDTDISNTVLHDRKNIRLSVQPAFAPEQRYVSPSPTDFRFDNRGDVFVAKGNGNSDYLQKYMFFDNELDKASSIKHWLDTTSFGRQGNQASEGMSRDGYNTNLGALQAECSSLPIVMNLTHDSTHLSTPEKPSQDCFTNGIPFVQDPRRSNLWPREPTPSPILSSPDYFKLFKSAAQGSFRPPGSPAGQAPGFTQAEECLPLDRKKKDRTTRGSSPTIDKGNPKKIAALTAAGHSPSRRTSKNQDLRQCGSFFSGRGLWATCLLYFCVLVVVFEVGAIVLLRHGKMLPSSKIVESWLHQFVDELSQNVTEMNFTALHENALDN